MIDIFDRVIETTRALEISSAKSLSGKRTSFSIWRREIHCSNVILFGVANLVWNQYYLQYCKLDGDAYFTHVRLEITSLRIFCPKNQLYLA